MEETFLRGDLLYFLSVASNNKDVYVSQGLFKSKSNSLFAKGRDYEQTRVQIMKMTSEHTVGFV